MGKKACVLDGQGHRHHVFYGWVVCIICTMQIFVIMGLISNGFSIFLPFIIEENGLTYSQGSFLVTLRCLVSFVAMLSIGWYYKAVSLRVGTGIAVLCGGVSFLLYGVAHSYFVYCLGSACSGLAYGLGTMIPVSILINRWFVERKALALGICSAGSGIATVLQPSITTVLIEELSLGAAFLIESGVIFLVVAAVFLFLRNGPEEMGLSAYGATEAETGVSMAGDRDADLTPEKEAEGFEAEKAEKAEGFTCAAGFDGAEKQVERRAGAEAADVKSSFEAEDVKLGFEEEDVKPGEMGNLSFGAEDENGKAGAGDEDVKLGEAECLKSKIRSWTLVKPVWIILGCVCALMGALANPGFSHLAVLFRTEGFDSMTVAWIISIVGITITVGKLIYGQAVDKMGGYKASIFFAGILTASLICCSLSFLQSFALCLVAGVLFGIGCPITTIGQSVWASDLASSDQFPKIVRRLQVVYAAGALVFASVPGIIADLFGSYIPAYIMFMVFMAAAALGIRQAYRIQCRELLKKEIDISWKCR